MSGASIVVVLKGLVEVAALLLAARGAVRLLSFGRHEVNPVHRMLVVATAPLIRVARRLAPAPVADQHLPLVAFLLLFWVWAGLVILKVAGVHGGG